MQRIVMEHREAKQESGMQYWREDAERLYVLHLRENFETEVVEEAKRIKMGFQ